MSYAVTRQHYYYSMEHVVEVASGGLDYAGADALVAKYAGEFQEFDDPREAVETAITICRAWRQDGQRNAKVAFGSTGGMGMEIEPTTYRGARIAAEESWRKLPKCPDCGNPLPKIRWRCWLTDDEEYCSEACANRAGEEVETMNEED